MSTMLIDAFKFHRLAGKRATAALDFARKDAASKIQRYPSEHSKGWQPEHDGARYVETLHAAGLRFVGFADAILNLRHKGYFADDEYGGHRGTYRGVILQLPGRGGRALYLAGYADPENKGAYLVDVSQTFSTDARDEDEQAQREAARSGDGFAETHAEREREYDQAWSAGQRYADLQTEARTATVKKRRLARDLRKVQRDATAAGVKVPASVCAALRAQISNLTTDIRRATDAAAEILSGNYRGTLLDAFNEGAGEKVL